MNKKCSTLKTCPPAEFYVIFLFGHDFYAYNCRHTFTLFSVCPVFNMIFFMCTLKMGLFTEPSNANSKAIHLPLAVIVAISRNAVSTPASISFVMSFCESISQFRCYIVSKMFQSNTNSHWSVLKLRGKKKPAAL